MPRHFTREMYALMFLGFVPLAQPALADGVDDALERVERAADDDPAMSGPTRDALRDLVRALRGERAAAPDATALREAIRDLVAEDGTPLLPRGAPASAPPRWSVSGDLRLRHESNVRLDGDADDRHRQRVRLRIAGGWHLDEEFDVGARVRTGSRTDSNSPHQTLGEGFHSFEIALDRAFLHYRPASHPGLDAWGGKFGSPLVTNPVYGELVWDADVQPEGLAVRHVSDLGDERRLGLVAGEYVVIEQGGGNEASAFVAQAWLDAPLCDDWTGRASLSWHRFTDLTPDGSAVVLTDNQGNAISAPAAGGALDFTSEFSVLDAVVSASTSVNGVPLTLAAEWIQNLDATIDDDTGYALGAAFGRATEPGDVRVSYQWQVIEQDALASAFAGDDFLLPTNQRGHVASVRYQLTEAINVQLAGYASEIRRPSATDRHAGTQWRLRFEINVGF